MNTIEIVKADNGGYVAYHDNQTSAFTDAAALLRWLNSNLEAGVSIINIPPEDPASFIPRHDPYIVPPQTYFPLRYAPDTSYEWTPPSIVTCQSDAKG